MSHWFAVRLLFETTVRGDESLFEDRVVVFAASDEEDAKRKAGSYGIQEEDEFQNAEGNMVDVCFREIIDCQQLLAESLVDGTEVYSTFLSPTDLEAIRRTLQPLESTEIKSPR